MLCVEGPRRHLVELALITWTADCSHFPLLVGDCVHEHFVLLAHSTRKETDFSHHSGHSEVGQEDRRDRLCWGFICLGLFVCQCVFDQRWRAALCFSDQIREDTTERCAAPWSTAPLIIILYIQLGIYEYKYIFTLYSYFYYHNWRTLFCTRMLLLDPFLTLVFRGSCSMRVS